MNTVKCFWMKIQILISIQILEKERMEERVCRVSNHLTEGLSRYSRRETRLELTRSSHKTTPLKLLEPKTWRKTSNLWRLSRKMNKLERSRLRLWMTLCKLNTKWNKKTMEKEISTLWLDQLRRVGACIFLTKSRNPKLLQKTTISPPCNHLGRILERERVWLVRRAREE